MELSISLGRRALISKSGFVLAGATLATVACAKPTPKGRYEINLTDAEWKTRLTPAQYATLRQNATDVPFKSPFLNEHRAGIFLCAGCNLPGFSSRTKFDSGTGWPSFYDFLPNAVRTETDNTLGMARVEVHCRRCGGHLGHVFDDGPAPTGKRYCLNGTALKFAPGKV